jgi:hypothetical protein
MNEDICKLVCDLVLCKRFIFRSCYVVGFVLK